MGRVGQNVTESDARTLDAKPAVLVPMSMPHVDVAWTIHTYYSIIGHTVMDGIAAPDCKENEAESVAKAVQWHISVPAPNSVPGPVGGGPIVHPFFNLRIGISYHLPLG
jgi:hypothetical protein